MRVLALNTGSSSLKFLVATVAGTGDGPPRVAPELRGQISGIGREAVLRIEGVLPRRFDGTRALAGHEQAVQWMFEALSEAGHGKLDAAGHRIVHGGETFRAATRLDEAALHELARLSELAPLHNPAGVAGIHATRTLLGDAIPMVAVFDTAFHRTMPARATVYALPKALAARHGIRRYGFHGIAHASLAQGYARCTGRRLTGAKLITLQLGNGCSVTAIRDGASVDTSMGFTPLEGLVMGTRAGDLDPAIVPYLVKEASIPPEDVERWLNERSGLLGLSGLSRDMQEVLRAEAAGHPDAALAIELFCYRARKYIGAYLAALEGADAIVFGGGIGEHQPEIRARVCRGLEWAGLRLDDGLNQQTNAVKAGQGIRISAAGMSVEAYVVGVDEESAIAEETARVLMTT